MVKQVGGFAVFGVVVALLGAALGRPAAGWTAYVSGTSFVGDFGGPWASQATSASVGAVVGGVVGAVLHASGTRLVGPDGNRTLRVVTAGTGGVALGLSPTLYWVSSAFAGLPADASVAVSYGTILFLYALSAILGYVLAIAAVRWTLQACGDALSTHTTKALALVLPVGGLVATFAGMGTAWLLGFTTTVPTLVAVVLVVVLVLAATFALTRGWVVARHPAR